MSCRQYSLFVESLVFLSCELLFVCFSFDVLNLLVSRDILSLANVFLSQIFNGFARKCYFQVQKNYLL